MSIRLGYFYPNARSVHALSGAVSALNGEMGDLRNHVAMTQAAEEIGFDYLFMMDSWAPFGPETAAGEVMNPMLVAPVLPRPRTSASSQPSIHRGFILYRSPAWDRRWTVSAAGAGA